MPLPLSPGGDTGQGLRWELRARRARPRYIRHANRADFAATSRSGPGQRLQAAPSLRIGHGDQGGIGEGRRGGNGGSKKELRSMLPLPAPSDAGCRLFPRGAALRLRRAGTYGNGGGAQRPARLHSTGA